MGSAVEAGLVWALSDGSDYVVEILLVSRSSQEATGFIKA